MFSFQNGVRTHHPPWQLRGHRRITTGVSEVVFTASCGDCLAQIRVWEERGWQWKCKEQPEESFPVVPDVLWIDLDNAAGLNGRRALASLIVLVSITLPGWPSAPSLMELESCSCCHRLCWRSVGGAIGSSRCFLLQQGRVPTSLLQGLSGRWSRVSKCQALGWE